MQRLHDTLAKLAPKSKVGGLGLGGLGMVKCAVKDPSLPQTRKSITALSQPVCIINI